MRPIRILVVLLLLATVGGVKAAEDLPRGVTVTPLSKVKWVKSADSTLEYANLLGDPDKLGPYLRLVKWPPNTKNLAHKHPDDRYGMVISGVHYVGYGEKFDEKKMHANSAGTSFTEPANTAHFGMTKREPAILYFYGTGPSGSTRLEQESGRK